MIASRGEYRFARIGAGIRVDGGVMPARDAAGDGSWRALRGEDPAFVVEAACERAAALSGEAGLARVRDVGRALSPAPFAAAVRLLRGMCLSGARRLCGAPGADAGDLPAEDGWAEPVHPAASLGLRLAEGGLAAEAGDFASGRPLVADAVRRVYRDLQLARHVEAGGLLGAFPAPAWRPECRTSGGALAWALVPSALDSEDLPEAADFCGASTVYAYSMNAVFGEGGALDAGQSHAYEFAATEGTFRLAGPEGAEGLVDPSGAALWALLRFSVDDTLAGGTSQWQALARVEASGEGRAVSAPAAAVAEAARRALAARGVAPREPGSGPPDEYGNDAQTIDCRAEGLYAVVPLAGRTDVSETGWSWEPGGAQGRPKRD